MGEHFDSGRNLKGVDRVGLDMLERDGFVWLFVVGWLWGSCGLG